MFPGVSDGKEPACNEGDLGSIPGLKRFPGIELEKGMGTHSNIIAWRIPWTKEIGELQFHGVTKSWTQATNTQTRIQDS